MGVYKTLRAANRARQIEWDTNGDMTLSYSGNELAGETGEMIEAVAQHFFSDEGSLTAVAEEIGDVIICCDLIALRLNIPLDLAPERPSSGENTVPSLLLDIAMSLGGVCNAVKKRERESFGMVGSTTSLRAVEDGLNELVYYVFWLADFYDLDAEMCAAAKFNKTSTKYGLQTIMVL